MILTTKVLKRYSKMYRCRQDVRVSYYNCFTPIRDLGCTHSELMMSGDAFIRWLGSIDKQSQIAAVNHWQKGYTWEQVALKRGGGNTSDTIRQELLRRIDLYNRLQEEKNGDT